MSSSSRQMLKNSGIYGLGSIANKIIGFVLLPIYTRYLTLADYGVLSLVTISVSIVTMIANSGMASAMFREVIYSEQDESTVASTTLYYLMGSSILLFGTGIIFSAELATVILGDLSYKLLLQTVLMTGIFGTFNVVFNAHLRITGQAILYSIVSISSFVLGAALNIYFIVFLGQGLQGLVTAQLILAVLQAIVSLIVLIPHLRLVFSLALFRKMIKFGIALIPGNIAALALTSADRYLLNHYHGPSETGLYSIGYTVGMVVSLAVQAIQLAWPAQMFEIAKNETDSRHKFSLILTYYMAGIGSVALFVSVLARDVLMIMSAPAFHKAYIVVPFIALSYVLYGMRFMTTIGVFTKGKTGSSSALVVVVAIFNLGLSVFLIPRYGMMGAAWATLISYLLLALANLRLNIRLVHIPYEYGRLAKLAIAWGIIFGISMLLNMNSPYLSILLKLPLMMLFPILLLGMKWYSEHELKKVKQILFQVKILKKMFG
jgi:O-antigen/teichoic acid export membrane protein